MKSNSSNTEIYEKLIGVISKSLHIDQMQVKPNTNLNYDLGVSSMQLTELVCDIEDEFHCTLSDESLASIQTVQDLANSIISGQKNTH
ncbi:Acyl carrier protein [Legionella moravica]|uniref:Acyl carrier protein AcpXL n=1 Tax=Legionella moravica TaxID=39962 RepID=A0A378JY80_9GAMM|nr:phosphopantetheine-binding protein [Legionella moravica]KTD30799.1 Acyl carrier protein [Legionella moravica]STX63376.1 Acyl carrier protein [Legionella moravica]